MDAYSGVPGLCGASGSCSESLPILLQEGNHITLQTEHGAHAWLAVLLACVLQVGECCDAHVSQLCGGGRKCVMME